MITPDQAAEILAVADLAAGTDDTDPLDEFARMTLRNRPETVTAALEPAGFAIGYAGQVAVVVEPSARGRGIGTSAAKTLLDALGSGPLEAWSHGHQPAAARLATRYGFAPVRALWVMRRPLADALPEPRPRNWTLRGYRPEDAHDLLRINAAAFADHPEQGAMDDSDLAMRMAEDWYDPADLLVAERDGRLLGFHWTKRHSETEGEVYVVGVAPEAQGLGLGTALTLAGLKHLAARGITDVHLYVESDNEPAIAVYQKLGFTHVAADTHVMYRRP